MSRRGKGRRRLEMVKISKQSNLLVTFTKRRYGVFKKASDLSTLCGADIIIVIFSPGKKVFCFGHPSVETVIDRFYTGNTPPRISGAMQLIEAHRNVRIQELNIQLTQALDQLEIETKRGEEIERIRTGRQPQCWWESPIEELDLAQLEQLKASLEVLRQNVTKQAEQLLFEPKNPPQYFVPTTSNYNEVLRFDPKNNGGLNTNTMPYQYPKFGFGSGFF